MPVLDDLRYSIRSLRNSPGFSVTAILTLALGVAASTAIFSVVDAVLLRPLPFDDPGKLFLMLTDDPGPGKVNDGTSIEDFTEWKAQAHSLGEMSAFFRQGWSRATLTGGREPRAIQGSFVDGAFFRVFPAPTLMGRTVSTDDVKHHRQVVVLSHALWMEQFGGAPDVVGRDIEIEKRKWQVIGVMPEGFEFPFRQTRFWAPVTAHPAWISEDAPPFTQRWTAAVRLPDGVLKSQAQAEIDTIATRMQKEHPDRLKTTTIQIVPFVENLAGGVRTPLSVLMAAVLLVLLIACGNVANLFLARGASRGRELAVRTALGASRQQLVRLLLTESVAVALAAGAIGVLLSGPAVRALEVLAPLDIPRLHEAGHFSFPVLGFAGLLCVVSVLIFGVLPAARISPMGPSEAMKEGGRSGRAARSSRSLHRMLVAGQFALALILLSGSGLLIRSFVAVLETDPGFNPVNVLTVRVSSYPKNAFDRLLALPGVRAVGAVSTLFFLEERRAFSFRAIDGRGPEPDTKWQRMIWTQTQGDYFQAMGIRLLRGRYFAATDTADTPPVAIINETLARRFWPGQNAVGQRVKGFDPRGKNDDWVTIVGVVKDTRSTGLERDPASQIYEVAEQRGEAATNIVIRSDRDPVGMAASVRSLLRSLDTTAVISNVATVEDQLHDQTARRRFQTWILSIFSAFALLLAAIGIYGVMQYSIMERTPEIGIRIAIGARSSDVFGMVLREGLLLAASGIAIGAVGALWTTRLLASLLYRVPASDPFTFAGVGLLLAAAGLAASYLPARRAANVDPMVALRYE